jgi:hypothetical protein
MTAAGMTLSDTATPEVQETTTTTTMMVMMLVAIVVITVVATFRLSASGWFPRACLRKRTPGKTRK